MPARRVQSAPVELVAAGIYAASIALLLTRPRRLPEWPAALGGGLLMVVVGALPPGDALARLVEVGDVAVFFLGLGIVSAAAECAGVFGAVAAFAARAARGSHVRLLLGLYLAGALVTVVLSNDATALLLTPVALALAVRLGLVRALASSLVVLVANASSFLTQMTSS